MKHNPRLNEKMARLPGFADLHPLQPQSTVQGALELIDTLAHWLMTLTGMPAVAHVAQGRRAWRAVRPAGDPRGARGAAARRRKRDPGAGIRARHQPGDGAAFAGYAVESIPADDRGRVDLAALQGASSGPTSPAS